MSAVTTMPASSSCLLATIHPDVAPRAYARPIHHSPARAAHGAISRNGPQATENTIATISVTFATTRNGTAISFVFLVATASRTPITASTATMPPAIFGSVLNTSSGMFTMSVRRWCRSLRNCAVRFSHSSTASWSPAALGRAHVPLVLGGRPAVP